MGRGPAQYVTRIRARSRKRPTPDLRSSSWSIHSQRPRESGGPSAHGSLPPRHGLRRRRRLLLLLHRTLFHPLNSIPDASPVSPPAAAPRQATAAAGPLGTPPPPGRQTRPRHPCFRLSSADDLLFYWIISAGSEVPPEMRLGEAGRRRRWVVGSASGSWRIVQAARAVRRILVRARVRDGGGGDDAPGVAAGACRHAVHRPAAGGRVGGSRGHQYRFCFSYDNCCLCSLMISKLILCELLGR